MSRREQAERRREELLDAALEIFVEKGIAGASMKDIASAAGVAQGLLYHYFDGKDDLVEGLLRERGFLPELRRRLDGAAGRPASDVLPEMMREYAQVLSTNTGLVALFFGAGADPRVRAAMSEFITEGQRLLAEFLDSRVAAGELRAHDTRLLAHVLLTSVATGGYLGVDADPDRLVDLCLNGAAANPPRTRHTSPGTERKKG